MLARWVKSGPERKTGSGKKPAFPELEIVLFEWFVRQREERLAVSVPGLKKQALKVAETLLINQKDDTKFYASRGWLTNWMNRFNVSIRRTTHVGQKMSPISLSQAKKFVAEFESLISKHKYELDAIANVDETPIYWCPNFKSTLDLKGIKNFLVH